MRLETYESECHQFERWMWIDFFGLNNTHPDFGVRKLLDAAGFVPQGVSLLMSNADFVHTHEGCGIEKVFPIDYCAYGDFNYHGREEFQRQIWTSSQLIGLVQEFKRSGVQVFFSLFDVFSSREWIGQHTELFHVRKNGERIDVLCPWKRLACGVYYEDFFIPKLIQTIKDYGFDGFHCADGYAHQRIPISEGDFSDDMVSQFVEVSGIELPALLSGVCDDSPPMLTERAIWIWKEARKKWIGFYVARTTRFMSKLVDSLRVINKRIVVNSAWTKDPFEAMYRYGVDYQAIASLGIDAFIVETAAGAAELDGFERIMGRRPIYSFMASLLMMRSYAKGTDLIYLNGIKDSTEGWSVLRHAPPTLETEIHLLTNLFTYTADGAFQRCVVGPMACTADDIRDHEWKSIREWWDASFQFLPERLIGVTLIWSDHAFRNQLDDYIDSRCWTMHRLAHHLLERNVPIHSVATVDDLDMVRGSILVLNSHLLPHDEREKINAYRGGECVMIGRGASEYSRDAIYDDDLLFCSFKSQIGEEVGRIFEERSVEKVERDLREIIEPSGPHAMFYHDLYYRELSQQFLDRCAEIIFDTVDGVRVLTEKESVKLVAMEDRSGLIRLLIGNDSHWYITTRIDVGREIRTIRTVSRFPYIAIEPEFSSFDVRVPGRGITILEIELAVISK